MGNDDLRNALMRAQGIQGFMGGGMASHTMPDGTVMPGATHADYESMGYQEGGPAQSISPELQERINRFAGAPMDFAEGAVSDREMAMMGAPGAVSDREMAMMGAGQPSAPAQELQQAIQQLEIQKTQTSDPDEIQSLNRMIEVAMVGANAPLREMALEMQSAGRGEDTALAHLRPGEVILPPEAFEDVQFENTVAKKFEELGIDPELAGS